jgi:hypothetical protein
MVSAQAPPGSGAAEPAESLQVFTVDSWRSPEPVPIVGEYELDAGQIRFRPRYPFSTGLDYVARLSWSTSGDPVTLTFRMPAPQQGESTRVTDLFPSGEEVPANLLRLYVHFSAPMDPRGIERHVRLEDETGDRVELAFVEIDNGLWDPERRRLTLFLHPGRIKRGVGPHERMGPPLREGGAYVLRIDGAARDALGFPLGDDWDHRFRAGPADRTRPRPESWTLLTPEEPGAPLRIDFHEVLDAGLLRSKLAVLDGAGNRVPGTAWPEAGELGWQFLPERPWKPGSYRLRVHPELEDPAGNRPGSLFDAEVSSGQSNAEPVDRDLAFHVPPAH